MAVSTLFRGYTFISGLNSYRTNGGTAIRVVTSLTLAVVVLICLGSHMYVGMGSIVDDYVQDGMTVAILKFFLASRILYAVFGNYNLRFGGMPVL